MADTAVLPLGIILESTYGYARARLTAMYALENRAYALENRRVFSKHGGTRRHRTGGGHDLSWKTRQR